MNLKLFFACMVLLLCTSVSKALIRNSRPVPILRSVLDYSPDQTATPARHYLNFSLTDMPRVYRDPATTSPQAKHRAGVVMLVIGSALLAGSAALVVQGAVQDSGGSDDEGSGLISYVFGTLIAIPALAFLVPGLFLTLKYRKNGKHPWTDD